MIRRKNLAICWDCHHKIYKGEIDSRSFRKPIGEPRDRESYLAGEERRGWRSD